jgi:hypothetical protein
LERAGLERPRKDRVARFERTRFTQAESDAAAPDEDEE